MNSRTLSSLAIAGFVLLGVVAMGVRYHSRQEAQTARENSRWLLTYNVSFEADQVQPDQGPPPKISLALPFNTPNCEVLNEEWNVAPLRDEVRTLSVSRTRQLNLYPRQPIDYEVRASFELRLSPRSNAQRQLPLESLSSDARTRYLRNEEDIPVSGDSVRNVLQHLPDDAVTKWEQLQWVFEYCTDIDSGSDGALDSAKTALETRKGTALASARAMVALCRAIDIPARLVTGFEIRQRPAARQHHVWVEVFQDQAWIPFDPEFGYTQQLPMTYVPVRRAGDTVIRSESIQLGVVSYSIVRLRPDERLLTSEVRHPLQIFNLLRLPVPMHEVMALLLLLPFGALITALMRNVVGIGTFGTFAPALLAMSFIYAAWQTGLAILIVVVTVGLVGRSLMERLRLLMVPRLSIVLTMVILCVVLCVSMLDYLYLTPSAQAVLLPMVILTILIERFHVTSEEDGMVFAIKMSLGTVAVAALCYLILRTERLGDFVLTYPEAHFFTLAAFIMLGRYAGYRLTELWRFRDLVAPSETPR